MGTENPVNFAYMGRSFDDLTSGDSSGAFSECNSDRSGEFPMASSQSRRLLISCASDNSDELIQQLVLDLESCSIDEQKQAAMEIRLLAKNKPENRLRIAKAGAVRPLISLISCTDPQLQEYGLELSCPELRRRRRNAACALLRLSQMEENKIAIGRSGSIPLLVNLLGNGGFRGKKDASTALYSLCSVKENKIRAVKAGIMRPLVELMADFGSNMVDKSAFVLSVLVSMSEARTALVDEGGIPVLVELVEDGTQRQKEIAAVILLQICEESVLYRTMVAREGAIPPLVALSQSGTNRAKQKAEKLIELLRQPRSGNYAATTSNVSV
ncbi:U-box domain-containing protein 4 [Cucurbita argyrosperma subsp. argyrosperma]|nr:U-box domain-containing protein 4 [Cucurbita argyrosperma subsp. argyrosperma]